MKTQMPLFPISLIGSWPRESKILKYLHKNEDNATFQSLIEQQTKEIVTIQEENGVDIESLEEISMQIVKMHFSSTEYEWIIAQPEISRSLEILKLWTIKESYLKYQGVGINQSLDLVDALRLVLVKKILVLKTLY